MVLSPPGHAITSPSTWGSIATMSSVRLDAFREAVERPMDLAEVNGRVFVNNVSLGVYAAIVRSPEYRDAKLDTTLSTLPTVLGPEHGRSTCGSRARTVSCTTGLT